MFLTEGLQWIVANYGSNIGALKVFAFWSTYRGWLPNKPWQYPPPLWFGNWRVERLAKNSWALLLSTAQCPGTLGNTSRPASRISQGIRSFLSNHAFQCIPVTLFSSKRVRDKTAFLWAFRVCHFFSPPPESTKTHAWIKRCNDLLLWWCWSWHSRWSSCSLKLCRVLISSCESWQQSRWRHCIASVITTRTSLRRSNTWFIFLTIYIFCPTIGHLSSSDKIFEKQIS